MSRKQTKHHKKKAHSCPNENGGKQHAVDDMNISGKVEISRSPSLEQQHTTERGEDTASHKKNYAVAALTLFFVIVYAGLTSWMAIETRQIASVSEKTFSVIYRPYIGMNQITTGAMKNQERPKEPPIGMYFQTEVKNFGAVPGADFVTDLRAFVNGQEVISHKIPDQPGVLFPGQTVHLEARVSNPEYEDIMFNRRTLSFKLTVRYSDPGHEYQYYDEEQYVPELNSFVILSAYTK